MYRTKTRTALTLLSVVIVASLTSCAAETPAADSPSAPAVPSIESTQTPATPTPSEASPTPSETAVVAEPTPASVWPSAWPADIPHPETGTALYSHSERDAIFKLGLTSTREDLARLTAEFTSAGYSDDIGGSDDDSDSSAEVHKFFNGEWRIIVKGVEGESGFEIHYIAKRV